MRTNVIRVSLKIKANSRNNEIKGFLDDVLKVSIKSPAESGLANHELLDFLADYLNVKGLRIRIIKGTYSSNKVVEIQYKSIQDLEELTRKIKSWK